MSDALDVGPPRIRRQEERLLPRRWHWPLSVAVTSAVAGLTALGVSVTGHQLPTGLDAALSPPAPPPSPVLRGLFDAAAIVLPGLVPLVVLGLAAVCWHLPARRASLFCLAAPVTAVLVTEALKPLLGRPPTTGTGWMFPSGHVTAVASAAATAAVLLMPGGVLAGRLPLVWLRASWLLVVTVPVATSVGTVAQLYHHPTDVLGALCVAAVTVPVVAAVLDRAR